MADDNKDKSGFDQGSGQLFGRRLSLFVGAGGSGLELAPDPTSLPKLTFSVKQHDLETPNIARIRVFNLADATVKRIQTEFTRVILQAGYVSGNFGQVFDGTIIQTKRGNESAHTSYVDIIAGDGDEAYAFAIVNSAVAKGSSFKDRLDALTKAAGLKPGSVTPPADSSQLPRGRVYYGMWRDHMRDWGFSTDSKWFVQGGQLQVYPVTSYPPGEVVKLTSASGLIGFPQQTEAGIQMRCLLNPKIQPGTRVQIDNKSVQLANLQVARTSSAFNANAFLPSLADDGIYRVIVSEAEGDTWGDPWWQTLACIGMNQPLTPSLIAKGYS